MSAKAFEVQDQDFKKAKGSGNMKKVLYIIPGFGENTNGESYREIARIAERKGYAVVKKHPNWSRPLSEQIFKVNSHDVLFGFSLGAVLVYMVAQQYSCKKIILASMTPFSYFTGKELQKIIGALLIKDLKKMRRNQPFAKVVTMYGENENIKGDIIVPSTGHELNDVYIREIERLLT